MTWKTLTLPEFPMNKFFKKFILSIKSFNLNRDQNQKLQATIDSAVQRPRRFGIYMSDLKSQLNQLKHK